MKKGDFLKIIKNNKDFNVNELVTPDGYVSSGDEKYVDNNEIKVSQGQTSDDLVNQARQPKMGYYAFRNRGVGYPVSESEIKEDIISSKDSDNDILNDIPLTIKVANNLIKTIKRERLEKDEIVKIMDIIKSKLL